MTPFQNAYPQDIKALTPLRFAAAMWVLLYFFGDRMGLEWRQSSGFIAKGYMGVDLFFILSGFILAHVYGPQVIEKRFNFGSFLWARLARLYPVHLVTLGILIVLAVLAKALGVAVASAFDFTTLWGQFLMVQAWGFIPAGGWNHPAWSISAEWFAYLVFPLSFALIGVFRRKPWVGVVGSSVFLFLLFVCVPIIPQFEGVGLTELTSNGGALRIIPSFLMGVALWRLGQMVALNAAMAWAGVAVSGLWVVIVPSLGANDAIIWLGLSSLIFCLAETSKSSDGGWLGAPSAIWLGEASYSLYMIHMPVDLVWFQAIKRLLPGSVGEGVALAAVLGALVMSLIAAGVLYQFIERPARAWLRTRDPFKKRPIRAQKQERVR